MTTKMTSLKNLYEWQLVPNSRFEISELNLKEHYLLEYNDWENMVLLPIGLLNKVVG